MSPRIPFARHEIGRRHFLAMAATALFAVTLAGCGGAPAANEPAGSAADTADNAVELQVFAANSLEKAMPEVQALYTEKTGVTFADTQFKASGDLVEQMRAGAPVDLLVTASTGTMDDAAGAGLVDDATRTDMFVNDLVIARAEGSEVEISSLEDVASIEGRVAIGDAATVPAGKYANQSLSTVCLYTGTAGDDGEYVAGFAERVALADKVGTAAKYVSTGDAAIAFVYSSDIFRYDGIEQAFICPEDSHKPIVYPGAVSTASQNVDAAADFLDFCLNDAEAQKIWAKYGFELSA